MKVLHRIGSVVSLLATPLQPSHYLELVRPLWSARRLRAKVESVWDEAAGARTLVLRPARGFRRHRAGQHIRVGVAIDGRFVARTYSIASSPDRNDGCIAITVKNAGRVSRALVRDVRAGDFVSISLPQGDFCLPDAAPVRPLFVTAGSGITPVMSMLRTFALRGRMPDTVHVHYAPHRHDVIFGAELEQLAAAHPGYRLHVIPTRDGGRHFTAETLAELCPDWRDRDAWTCGPPSLIESLERHFHRDGNPHRLHVERFTADYKSAAASGGPPGAPAEASQGTVRFRRSGVEARTDGQKTLLHLAEDAGIDAAYGCRMGICRTCDTTLLSGCVRDLRNGRRIDEPGALVPLCVSAAAGDVELER